MTIAAHPHRLTEGEPWETKGAWEHATIDDKPTAVVSCPTCGEAASLSSHSINSGKVTPSLDCPYRTCSFHEYVELVGWDG